jgi:hypothetical protein
MLLRLNWASIPLLGVCATGAGLARSVAVEGSDPSSMSLFGYFVLSMGLSIFAGTACILAAMQSIKRSSA